jgi:hypothetical protein
MVRKASLASEMACRSSSASALPANACSRKKRAPSAASTRCLSDRGSPSRSAASNSRCHCGYFMVWAVEEFCSDTSKTNAGPLPLGEQALIILLNRSGCNRLQAVGTLRPAVIRRALVAKFQHSGAYGPDNVRILGGNLNGCCSMLPWRMVEWWLGQYAVSAALAQRCAVCRDFFAIVCMS